MTGSDAPAAGFDGKLFARSLTAAPGVYRMYGAEDAVLYVGKAASLNKRVASYFNRGPREPRLYAMISQIERIEVTVTRTEGEALLLENQLIKSLKPRYNVLLRDDKSYPYIYLTTGDPVPRLAFFRGARSMPGRFFGPYPSASTVRDTLDIIHKLFKLRSCEDSVFRNRSRPCLQYQIQRCSAPCVNLIDPAAYHDSVFRTELFLDGKGDALVDELGASMEKAAQSLDFEEAARLRDLIANLRKVQARQYVDGDRADLDVLACVMDQGQACVMLLCFRDGMNLGTRGFFPRTNGSVDPAEVLSAFVTQYYLDQRPPREIVLSHDIADRTLIEDVFSQQAGVRVQLKCNVRGDRARYLALARHNAELQLATELSSSATQRARLTSLQELLQLPQPPRRTECFDISHTMGEATVASCVVFDTEGAVRQQYRRYNITGVTGGDDYAAMRQVLERRFKRAKEEGVLPDLLLIDGGRGQLAQAMDVLKELDVEGIRVVGVAKGPERRAGHEALVMPDGTELRPGPESPALQLIQQIRDEAHRFAITGHRGKRAKARQRSKLEDIPGIGSRRRAMLLKHFGGLAALRKAGVEEISRVEGINAALAQRIYTALHGLEPGGAPGKHVKITIPTLLTIFRIALIPVLVVVFYLPYAWSNIVAAMIFALGAITDWLDGWIARRYGMYSKFGAFLDPVADKLAVAVALVLIVQFHHTVFMALIAAVIIGREITISALREWMAEIGQRARVKVAGVGKLKTIVQMVALVMLIFREDWLGLPIFLIGESLLAVAAALTLWSAYAYVRAAWPVMREE